MPEAQGLLRFLGLLLVSLVLGLTPTGAADTWPVARGPSHEPDPHPYQPVSKLAVLRDFLEDSSACVLYAGTTHLLDPDGTLETITHEITHLTSRKGIDKLGEFRNIAFDPAYEKLTLNVACIHKADGRTVAVEPSHVQLRDIGTDYQVYAHDKQLIISFPTLEVGDTVEVKWTVRGKHPEFAGHFFTRYTFGDLTFPVVLDELRVRVPCERPLSHTTLGSGIKLELREQRDTKTYHWRGHNMPRQPQDECLPSREELQPAVACSTFRTWAEVGQWKRRLRTSCWECTPDLRRVVAEQTRGLTQPVDRARALAYWLRRNIRYVSTGEKHDYTPHPPALVLANRFGDCKDTSQMLAVMLRQAGLSVELATLGALDDGQVLEQVPSPWGTHAILLVTIDGKEHWIDTTATLAGWDFLPRDDRDRLCYLVNEEGKVRLHRTPTMTADDNRTVQTTHVWVGTDGSSRCERDATWYGLAAYAQRDTFVDVPAGERHRQVTSDLLDANSHTRLVSLAVDEKALACYDRPVRAQMVFEIDPHFTGSPEREGTFSDSKVWNKLLAYNIAYDRKAPFHLPALFESQHRYVVHLPAGYQLDSLPADRSTHTRWGLSERTLKLLPMANPPALEITFRTRVERFQLNPDELEEFRTFQEEAATCHRVALSLKPTDDLDAAPLMEALLYWTPEDADAALLLAQLYQKNHHSQDARRVLQRARHYRPDVPALWELSAVCAPDNEVKESLLRELVRRFPDDLDHTIRLGELLVGLGRQKEARALLEPVTRKGSSSQQAQARFELARSYYRRDELQPALDQLDQAAKTSPDTVRTVRALQLRAQIYEEMKKPQDAIAALEQALQVDPEAELVLESLTRLQLAAGNRKKALDHLRRYVVVIGDDDSGRLLAAGYYLRLGMTDMALELAERARERSSGKAEAIIGLVYLHQGNLAAAARHLEKAAPDKEVLAGLLRAQLGCGKLSQAAAAMPRIDQVPLADQELSRVHADICRLLKRRDQLSKDLPAGAERSQDLTAALDALVCAEEARREGRPQAGIEKLLRAAFASKVPLGAAFALRGRLALEHGKLRQAFADSEQAIRLSPSEPGGYHVRGRVRLERGEKGAIEDLEKAVLLSHRQDADYLHTLADALFHAGRVEQALERQRAAVKLRPADRELADQLAAFEKAALSGS